MTLRVVALLVLGLAQMTGALLGSAPLQGLAAATAASPAPKVFSSVQGLETYSTTFFIEWWDASRQEHSLQLTPEIYSQLKGVYNRRNAYGAALAYAPIFARNERTRKMLIAVGRYALCGDAPLLRELGMDPDQIDGPLRIRLDPLPGTDTSGLLTEFTAPCD